MWTVCSSTPSAWSTPPGISECVFVRKLLLITRLHADVFFIWEISFPRWNYGLISVILKGRRCSSSLQLHTCDFGNYKRSNCQIKKNPEPVTPQFSRSIISNVITVQIWRHSSWARSYVASIRFWLVNDCLFFGSHMESAVYSLPLYSHWLSPATDGGIVIVLHCWSAL